MFRLWHITLCLLIVVLVVAGIMAYRRSQRRP